MLTKIEKKMLAKYKSVKVRDCNGAGFILSNGSIINTTDHAALCRTIGYGLLKVIQAGVCRFLSHTGREGKAVAFEYCMLTLKQKNMINSILRVDDYYTVITEEKYMISQVRPIRKIKF